MAWSARLLADLDNIGAAVVWALDRGDPDDSALAVRTLVGLATVGQWNRSIMIDSMAVRAIEVVADGPPAWRAQILALAAYYELNQGGPTAGSSSAGSRSATVSCGERCSRASRM